MSDRVAVVVGGEGAIGGAIVHQLRESGVRTLSLDLGGGDSLPCDVRDAESVARAVKDAERLAGRIDFVVYAAGVSDEGVVWKLAVEEWDQMHSVNLRGAFLVLRETIPILRRGDGVGAYSHGLVRGVGACANPLAVPGLRLIALVVRGVGVRVEHPRQRLPIFGRRRPRPADQRISRGGRGRRRAQPGELPRCHRAQVEPAHRGGHP